MVGVLMVVAFMVVVGGLPRLGFAGLSFAGLGLVGALVLARMVGRRVDRNQLGGGGHINDGCGGMLLDGFIDRALEAGQVDHRVGGGQGVDHLGREFKVVRLGTVRGQRGDGDVLTADLLGQVLQGIEGSHHSQGAVLAGLAGLVAGRGGGGASGQSERCSCRTCGDEDSFRHENHSLT